MNKFFVVLIFVIVVLTLATSTPPPALVSGSWGSLQEVNMVVSGMGITGSYAGVPNANSPLHVVNRNAITVPDYDSVTCKVEYHNIYIPTYPIKNAVVNGTPTISPGVNEAGTVKCIAGVPYGEATRQDIVVSFTLTKDTVTPPAPPTPTDPLGAILKGMLSVFQSIIDFIGGLFT